jgi:hypothetical protein
VEVRQGRTMRQIRFASFNRLIWNGTWPVDRATSCVCKKVAQNCSQIRFLW